MAALLRVALPTGSLSGRLSMYLREAGYNNITDSPDRTGFCGEANGIGFIRLDRRMIPHFVRSGYVHAGITGQDLYVESGEVLDEFATLRFARSTDGPSRWVLAAKADFDPGRIALNGREISEGKNGKVRIGCELVRFANMMLGGLERPLPFFYETVRIEGSEEQAVVAGLVDAVLVVTETGTSLRANGLEVIHGYGNIFESIPAIYTHCPNIEMLSALEALSWSLQSVIGASDFIELAFHFPSSSDLGRLCLPSDLSPTHGSLIKEGWSSWTICLRRPQYPDTLQRLKAAGAQNFVMKDVQGHLM